MRMGDATSTERLRLRNDDNDDEAAYNNWTMSRRPVDADDNGRRT